MNFNTCPRNGHISLTCPNNRILWTCLHVDGFDIFLLRVDMMMIFRRVIAIFLNGVILFIIGVITCQLLPYLVSVHKLNVFVIPASKARRESFLKKDSGQAGMTEKR